MALRAGACRRRVYGPAARSRARPQPQSRQRVTRPGLQSRRAPLRRLRQPRQLSDRDRRAQQQARSHSGSTAASSSLVAITGYGAWMLTRSQETTAPARSPAAAGGARDAGSARDAAGARQLAPAAGGNAPAASEAPAPRLPAPPGGHRPARRPPPPAVPGRLSDAGGPPADGPGRSPAAGGSRVARGCPGPTGKGVAHPRPKRRRGRRDDGAGAKDA